MLDAIVIGGGPAGATVAARLGQKQRRVVVLEQDRFPRFHIGESLLPASVPLLEELGVKRSMDELFLRKNAAEFVTADGRAQRRYPFAESLVKNAGHAYEVDRATFDDLLLKAATRAGAEVRQGWRATRFEVDGDGVTVVARDEQDHEETLRARVLVDASGQRSLVAGHLGLREMDRELKNFAVFSHFEGADRHSGEREGDISIVLGPEGWWWVIPLRDDRTSVGYVAHSRVLRGRKPDEQYFADQIAGASYVAGRLATARRVAPVRAVSDYSYRSRQLVGDRWLLVGDAAAFIDPVFSSGVCLGMAAAFECADSVDRALERGRFDRAAFAAYERAATRSVDTYSRFVKAFYKPGFADLLLHPTDRLSLRRAVLALLSGHATGRLDVSWRVAVVRAVGRANASLPLVPSVVAPGR